MALGVGIDIGAQWIKVVQVQTVGGRTKVTGALRLPRVTTADAKDGETLGLPPDFGKELAARGIRRGGVVGVTGREVTYKYLTTPPMPPDKLKLFIDMQVGERMAGGRGTDKGGEPPPLTYDFRILNLPIGLRGELVILTAAARNEVLGRVVTACQKAGVEARQLVPSSLALAQAYLRTQLLPPGETVVVVDVGHELIEVAVINESSVYSVRCGPGGGQKFDQALERVLKVDAARVQEFKHQRARLAPEGEALSGPEHVFQEALREGADAIASSIRTAVSFCRTQSKLQNLDYKRVFLSGGGARLSGLREYLEKKIQRPVQALDLPVGLDLTKLPEEQARGLAAPIPDMSVALGLALLDADPKAFHLQLLPQVYRERKAFWSKAVYAYVAGVVLLLGLVPLQCNASRSLAKSKEIAQLLSNRVQEANTRKSDFKSRLDKYNLEARRADYYLRQTRMGLVYVDLLGKLRANAPAGIAFTYVGPHQDGATSDALPMDILDVPLARIQVRGLYSPEAIQDRSQVVDQFFPKLREVMWTERPELDITADSEVNQPKTQKLKNLWFDVPLNLPKLLPPLSKTAAGRRPVAPSGVAPTVRDGTRPEVPVPANKDNPPTPPVPDVKPDVKPEVKPETPVEPAPKPPPAANLPETKEVKPGKDF